MDRRTILVIGCTAALVFAAADRLAQAAVFTVRNTADNGAGSLRRAISDANARPGLDSIVFNIGGSGLHSIRPLSPLPTISSPVFLDGTTQRGYSGQPVIELDGSTAGPSAHGLEITAGFSTVRGLAINRFSEAGLHLMREGGNIATACFIGCDSAGTNALGNGQGVFIRDGSDFNTIGGARAPDRNIISGNLSNGITIMDTNAVANVIQGNFIGVNSRGDGALPNGAAGVLIHNSAGNTLGGVDSGSRNIISGNLGSGIQIQGSAASFNVIQGNFIGVDAAGKRSLGNGVNGVSVADAMGLTLGGSETGAGNVVSGNGIFGVDLRGDFHVVQGNSIGTDVDGLIGLPNDNSSVNSGGLCISGSGHTIGGPEPGAGNLISGNSGHGGVFLSNANNVVIQGNLIGADRTGRTGLFLQQLGLLLVDSPDNTIGGTGARDGNTISGNEDNGVVIRGSLSRGNTIQRNLIGTDATGTAIIGNRGGGISLWDGATENLIGGDPETGNVISGNGNDGGVQVSGPRNSIIGNRIGTDGTGLNPLPNSAEGIVISTESTWVESNWIAHNGGDGVLVQGSASGRNTITANAIWANGGLGINLQSPGESEGAVTDNDLLDQDTGPNGLQNFPSITNVTVNGGVTMVEGELRSRRFWSYQIELFANRAADPSAHGEGEEFLQLTFVATDGDGYAGFAFSLPGTFDGTYLAATATDTGTGDTSEFGSGRQSTNAPALRITDIRVSENAVGISFTSSIQRHYTLEYSAALGGDADWRSVPGAEEVVGTGNIVTALDQSTNAPPARFYRVRLRP